MKKGKKKFDWVTSAWTHVPVNKDSLIDVLRRANAEKEEEGERTRWLDIVKNQQ